LEPGQLAGQQLAIY